MCVLLVTTELQTSITMEDQVVEEQPTEQLADEQEVGQQTRALLPPFSVVDLGRDPSSPVPGYRLGSRESARLGRFH